MGAVKTGGLEWAAAGVPLHGAAQSGDRYLITPCANGALAVVVDGIGHGPEAANASRRAIEVIRSGAQTDSLGDLVLECHRSLRNCSRGAVLSMARYDAEQSMMTWLGIGNVEGRLLLKTKGGRYLQEYLVLRPGLLGERMPALRPSVLRVREGDMLIFATDGIKADFAEHLYIDSHVDDIARNIIARCNKGTDDALVLVMRYMGHADAG